MGLTSWKNSPDGLIYKYDVGIAKNYLNEKELNKLNDLTNIFLVFAEDEAKERHIMTMKDWINATDDLLKFRRKEVLQNSGNISHKQAIEKASGRKCEKLAEISISEELKDIPARDRNNEATQIIYAGRFIELKGLMFLIDVIKEIKTDKPYHFTFYGSGELENEMKAKIKEYSLEDKVTLGGLVDHTEISKIYENADIFVHPTFRDSGGAVFVEAMAYRLPIIALNQSLSRELNDNKCGLFVNTEQSKNEIIKEFADKITLLIENRDLRQSLGENGFNYANSKFSLDYKFDTIYKNILQNL